MTSKACRNGGEELKVEFGRYNRGNDVIIEQITELPLVSLGLTSYTQKTHKDIIRKLNDLCRDLRDLPAKGQLNEAIGIGKNPANDLNSRKNRPLSATEVADSYGNHQRRGRLQQPLRQRPRESPSTPLDFNHLVLCQKHM
jgi:hypothetical protein